jgi:hypothetical protein
MSDYRYKSYKGYKVKSPDGTKLLHVVEVTTVGAGGGPINESVLNPAPDDLFIGQKPRKEDLVNIFDWGLGASDDMVQNLSRAILWSSTHDKDRVLSCEKVLCLVLRAFDDQRIFLHEDWMDRLLKVC